MLLGRSKSLNTGLVFLIGAKNMHTFSLHGQKSQSNAKTNSCGIFAEQRAARKCIVRQITQRTPRYLIELYNQERSDGGLKRHGRCQTWLSCDVWCEIPRVGHLGPQKEKGPEPASA